MYNCYGCFTVVFLVIEAHGGTGEGSELHVLRCVVVVVLGGFFVAPLAQARRVSRVYIGFGDGLAGDFPVPPTLSHTLAAATLPTRRVNI